jgi:DnaJ-class molecular chaperone
MAESIRRDDMEINCDKCDGYGFLLDVDNKPIQSCDECGGQGKFIRLSCIRYYKLLADEKNLSNIRAALRY